MNYTSEDVFISYSSKDQATAEKIKKLLEAPPRSVSCWMANDVTISSGDDFRQRIVDAIRRCKVFLFILSDSSMKSHWCSLELSFAIMENKKIYSIRIDDAPISSICSFKLGCAQISDASVNFDAAVEALAINVKNGRDRVLEEAKKRISEQNKHSHTGYLVTSLISTALLVAMITSLIILIKKIADYGGILELLSTSQSEVPDMGLIMGSFRTLLLSVIPFIITRVMLSSMLGKISRGVNVNSPSALYSMYMIMTRYNILFMIVGRKKALEHLEKSKNLGYPKAVKEYERLAKKGKI
jgi:hypothetical protein